MLVLLGAHMALNLIGAQFEASLWGDLSIAFGFAYGPTLFLYTNFLTHKDLRLTRWHLKHLLPGLLAFAVASTTDIHVGFFAAGIFVSLGGYGYAAWSLLARYRLILSHTRSNFDTITLQWLSQLLVLQVCLLGLNMVSVGLYSAGLYVPGFWGEVALFLALLFLVNFIIYNGLQRPDLFAGISSAEAELTEKTISNTGSGLSPSEAAETLQQVSDYMARHKPFLNPDLTVKALSNQLQLTARLVSQAINIAKGQNFSEYVNGYRIDFATALLRRDDEPSLSVMDVMLAAGFNTKSNFNRSFKDITGMTPLTYRKRHKY